MNKQQALRYMLSDYKPSRHVSTRYGPTELSRALITWHACVALTDKQKDITPALLDEVLKYVERGSDDVQAFLDYKAENGT